MRLGTQARREWSFRGAYQAFTVSVPLLPARLQYSSLLEASFHPLLLLLIPYPLRALAFRVIRRAKGLPGREYLPT